MTNIADATNYGGSLQLQVLSEEECTNLLKRHRLGRIRFRTAGSQSVLPVNYCFDGRNVVNEC